MGGIECSLRARSRDALLDVLAACADPVALTWLALYAACCALVQVFY